MTGLADERQVRAQAEVILSQVPQARCIAIGGVSSYEGPEALSLNGRWFDVSLAVSALQVREALARAGGAARPLVLLTPLEGRDDLGDDVLGRLARNRLHLLDPWAAVLDRFKARAVDPLLLRQRFLTEFLVHDGCPPAPGGVLSADLAWECLCKYSLGMPGDIADARTMLRWMSLGSTEKFLGAPPALREAAAARLEERCGAAGPVLTACLVQGKAGDALPAGLACRVLVAGTSDGVPELQAAAARLETYNAGRPLAPQSLQAWCEAAESVLGEIGREDGSASTRPWLARADALLAGILADAHAWRSGTSPLGFEQRLRRYGAQALACLASPAPQALEAASHLAQEVLTHAQCAEHERRGEQVRMSLRLLRWLCPVEDAPPPKSAGLAHLAADYVEQGAFVDWARLRLLGGDSVKELSDAYAALVQRAGEIREGQNESFARALAVSATSAGIPAGLLAIEQVMDRVLVPLVQTARVLLVVLDGLSWPVMRELLTNFSARGWSERRPEGTAIPPVLAAFPTVTEACRASLLSGRLVRGDASLEKQSFATHSALKDACRIDYPPVLLHRGDLESGELGILSPTVVGRIESDRHKVVGVVVNAVDDHLAKDGQIHYPWSIDTIRPLGALLDLAARSGRVVVIASDHGHVLERDTTLQAGGEAAGGDRWHPVSDDVGGHEISLQGTRVLCSDGSLVAAWSERVRYGMRKCGYHGGVAPQEALPPLVVLAPAGVAVKGWTEVPSWLPEWWQGRARIGTVVLGALSVKVPSDDQMALFAEEPLPREVPSWIGLLMDTAVLQSQLRILGSEAPTPARLAAFLAAMDAGEGRVPLAVLAQRLTLTEAALHAFLVQAARVLNLEGYPLVGLDVDGQTVVLRLASLREQFGVEGWDVRLTTATGESASLRLPFEPSSEERRILEAVARFGRMSEVAVAKIANTKRVGGLVEVLIDRLTRAGMPILEQEGTGAEGRVWVFRKERLP